MNTHHDESGVGPEESCHPKHLFTQKWWKNYAGALQAFALDDTQNALEKVLSCVQNEDQPISCDLSLYRLWIAICEQAPPSPQQHIQRQDLNNHLQYIYNILPVSYQPHMNILLSFLNKKNDPNTARQLHISKRCYSPHKNRNIFLEEMILSEYTSRATVLSFEPRLHYDFFYLRSYLNYCLKREDYLQVHAIMQYAFALYGAHPLTKLSPLYSTLSLQPSSDQRTLSYHRQRTAAATTSLHRDPDFQDMLLSFHQPSDNPISSEVTLHHILDSIDFALKQGHHNLGLCLLYRANSLYLALMSSDPQPSPSNALKKRLDNTWQNIQRNMPFLQDSTRTSTDARGHDHTLPLAEHTVAGRPEKSDRAERKAWMYYISDDFYLRYFCPDEHQDSTSSSHSSSAGGPTDSSYSSHLLVALNQNVSEHDAIYLMKKTTTGLRLIATSTVYATVTPRFGLEKNTVLSNIRRFPKGVHIPYEETSPWHRNFSDFERRFGGEICFEMGKEALSLLIAESKRQLPLYPSLAKDLEMLLSDLA